MAVDRRLVATAMVAAPFAAAMGTLPGASWWADGVQLWSVDTELDRDFEGTMRCLRALGFRILETAGLHGRSVTEFRAVTDAVGFRVLGAHVPLPRLLDDATASFDDVRELGADWVVCPAPLPPQALPGASWIAGMRRVMTRDAWLSTADGLNIAGAAALARGLRLAYHNHPFEFADVGGVRGFDLLMERTDPKLVAFELDVAWAMAGGVDPIALLRERRGRIRLLHAKGLRASARPRSDADGYATGVVGRDDVIPWRRVLAAAAEVGVEAAFIEQEPPHVQPALRALADCRAHLLRT